MSEVPSMPDSVRNALAKMHNEPIPQTQPEAPRYHGIDVVMHPGEWHPLHSLKVAIEARHNARGGKPKRIR